MKLPTILSIIGFLVFISVLNFITSLSKNRAKTSRIYHYFAKESVMTASENDFFNILTSLMTDGYLIFPQVHLSSLFNEKVKGQTWKYALRSINQKSVDYIIVDKLTRKTLIAIELDDPSHGREDRRGRDELVERIFSETTIPLIRFENYRNLSHEQIHQKLFEHLK